MNDPMFPPARPMPTISRSTLVKQEVKTLALLFAVAGGIFALAGFVAGLLYG